MIQFFTYAWEAVLLPLTTVVAWPATVIFGLLIFRRIIAYLFLSMESYNFFGTKGTIRPVHEVIEERAKAILDAETRESEYKDTIAKLDSKDLEKFEYELIVRKIVDRNKELEVKLSGLEIKNLKLEYEIYHSASPTANKLQFQIDALMAQIAKLQSDENINKV